MSKANQKDRTKEELQFLKNIGKRLKKLRKEYVDEKTGKTGVSQARFSEICDINIDTYKSWEGPYNNKTPDLLLLLKVCKACKCDIDYLLGNIDEHYCGENQLSEETGIEEEALRQIVLLNREMRNKERERIFPVETYERLGDFSHKEYSTLSKVISLLGTEYYNVIEAIDMLSVKKAKIRELENDAMFPLVERAYRNCLKKSNYSEIDRDTLAAKEERERKYYLNLDKYVSEYEARATAKIIEKSDELLNMILDNQNEANALIDSFFGKTKKEREEYELKRCFGFFELMETRQNIEKEELEIALKFMKLVGSI